MITNYRPQRSWAKVISLQASVCPHGGVSAPNFFGGGVCSEFWGGCLKFFFNLFSPQKISSGMHTLPPPPPPRRSMCGRYASYWNAFLFGYAIIYTACNVHVPLLPDITKIAPDQTVMIEASNELPK